MSDDDDARMRSLILSGCLPERQDEARALLDRYPPHLNKLPPEHAGWGGEDGVQLDPGKITTPRAAAQTFLHEVAHVAQAEAGAEVAHDWRFAAVAEGLTRRMTGTAPGQRGYDLHEQQGCVDADMHRLIDAEAERIERAPVFDPAAHALQGAFDRFLSELTATALLAGVLLLAGVIGWVLLTQPEAREWLAAWGPMLGFLALVVFIPWMLLQD